MGAQTVEGRVKGHGSQADHHVPEERDDEDRGVPIFQDIADTLGSQIQEGEVRDGVDEFRTVVCDVVVLRQREYEIRWSCFVTASQHLVVLYLLAPIQRGGVRAPEAVTRLPVWYLKRPGAHPCRVFNCLVSYGGELNTEKIKRERGPSYNRARDPVCQCYSYLG